jgi:hypothetical protein
MVEEPKVSEVQEPQVRERREQESQSQQIPQQLLNSNLLKEISKITNLVYFVGIIEGIKPLSERVDVLGIKTAGGEMVPPVLCQKNEKFIPKIGEKIICLGKFKIIKGETYIQMGEVYFDNKGIQQ